MKTTLPKVLALACVALSFAVQTPAHAESEVWRITALQGIVKVAEPGLPVADALKDQTVSVGSIVTTGAGGKAVVEGGGNRVTVGPQSRFQLAAAEKSGLTRILQNVGVLFFEVDKRPEKHFRVETPLLAAVVKGTAFSVAAGDVQDSVQVTRGLVGVSPLQGAGETDVPPGQSVRVQRSAPDAVVAFGGATPAGVALAAPAINYEQASGGLANAAEGGASNNGAVRSAAMRNENAGVSNGGGADGAGVGQGLGASNGAQGLGASAMSASVGARKNEIVVGAIVGAGGVITPSGVTIPAAGNGNGLGLGNGNDNGNGNGNGGAGAGVGLGNGGAGAGVGLGNGGAGAGAGVGNGGAGAGAGVGNGGAGAGVGLGNGGAGAGVGVGNGGVTVGVGGGGLGLGLGNRPGNGG